MKNNSAKVGVWRVRSASLDTADFRKAVTEDDYLGLE
jgi:hypothetical protein